MSGMSIGEKAALRIIFSKKVTKKDVVNLAKILPESEIKNAQKAFLKQNARLWRYWCAGLDARKAL